MAHAGDTISFEVRLPFDPKPKARPRTVADTAKVERAFLASKGRIDVFRSMMAKGASRTFTPKTTKEYEELIAVAAAAAMKGRPPLDCPLEVRMLFTLKGSSDKWPTSPADGDADNLEKAVLDALNGVAFRDDSLVVRCFKEKSCGAEPGILIEIKPANPAPFRFGAD